MGTEREAAGHITCAVTGGRELDAGPQLVFAFLVALESDPLLLRVHLPS